MLLVAIREYIRALNRLREESEDVIYNKQRALRILRPGLVRLHAVDGRPLALFLVALRDDGRDGAAGVGLHGEWVDGQLRCGRW